MKTLEGHKVYLLSDATNSNIVTTRNGNVWNNSILVGFNCRHYTIPFVPGTVPIIKYDPKIIEKEREITSMQRKYERAIVNGKTYHKLLVRAEKDGSSSMSKKKLARKKQEARNYYLTMNEKYKAFCSDNKRAYYPWRTQTMINNEFKEENNATTIGENIDKGIPSDIINTVDAIINRQNKTLLSQYLFNTPNANVLNIGSQNKHNPNTKGYILGKSVMLISNEEIKQLFKEYNDSDDVKLSAGQFKRTIEVDKNVAIYYDDKSNASIPTNRLTIHYGKKGYHIVPSRPKEDK